MGHGSRVSLNLAAFLSRFSTSRPISFLALVSTFQKILAFHAFNFYRYEDLFANREPTRFN